MSDEDIINAFSLFVGQPTQEGELKDIAKKFKRNLAKSLKNKHVSKTDQHGAQDQAP